jgi:hypothetical protein
MKWLVLPSLMRMGWLDVHLVLAPCLEAVQLPYRAKAASTPMNESEPLLTGAHLLLPSK